MARPPCRCGAASSAPSTASKTPISPSWTEAATPSARTISSASPRSASPRCAIPCSGRRRRRTAPRAPTGRGLTGASRRCVGSASRRSSASSITAAGRATRACSAPVSPRAWRNSQGRSPSAFRGSSNGRPSTSRSRRRASARSTACGTRTPATIARSSSPCSTSAAPPCSRCRRSAASIRRRGWCRPTTSAAPTGPRRCAMWSTSTTSGAGWRGTCCADRSSPTIRSGNTCSTVAPTPASCSGSLTTPARPTSSARTTT